MKSLLGRWAAALAVVLAALFLVVAFGLSFRSMGPAQSPELVLQPSLLPPGGPTPTLGPRPTPTLEPTPRIPPSAPVYIPPGVTPTVTPTPTPTPGGPPIPTPVLTPRLPLAPTPGGPTPTPQPPTPTPIPTPPPGSPLRMVKETLLVSNRGAPFVLSYHFLDWSPQSDSVLLGKDVGRSTAPVGPMQATLSLGEVWLYAIGGKTPIKLGDGSQARWSGASGKILVARYLSARDMEIYTVNADGSGAAKVADGECCLSTWLPDGTFAFTEDGVLHRRDPATGQDLPVPSLDTAYDVGSGETPKEVLFSPDGGRLAYRDGLTLWIVDMQSSQRTLITSRLTGSMAWSPEGTYLAYITRASTDAPELWVTDRNGAASSKLFESWSRKTWIDTVPWMPDGSALVFSLFGRELGGRIMAINASGSGLVWLGEGEMAVLSPDGKKIAYRKGMQEMWVAFLGTLPDGG